MSAEALRAYVGSSSSYGGCRASRWRSPTAKASSPLSRSATPTSPQACPSHSTTLFEIGSIGKTFTSLALLQLREEGLVDLHAPVTRYLPWFEIRTEYEPITLHHLLTHTAGIVEGPDLSSDSRFDVWALRESEAGAPGAHFHYSNVGYRVLGCVLEDVTGKEYAQIVRERIFDPLGLTAADPVITSETRKRLAVGYQRWYDDRPARRQDPMVPAPWVETTTGDGAPATTAEDLATFMRVFLNGGEPLLAAESFELMSRPAAEMEDGWSYGYGLIVGTQDGRSLVGHGGSMPGFGSMMDGDLAAELGVAVLVNGPDEGNLTVEVARVALDLYRRLGEAAGSSPILSQSRTPRTSSAATRAPAT